jgi:hypothetical protein
MTEQIRLGVIVSSANIVVEEWYPRGTQQERGVESELRIFEVISRLSLSGVVVEPKCCEALAVFAPVLAHLDEQK